MAISAGSRLGPYEVLSPLGAGGMGEVWRARDTRLSREVAIKVLPPEVAKDESRLKRFEREARSASALNHPNIVTIYDIGETHAIHWIAMEKVEGKTLREVLFGGALPIRKLLPIAAQIADGLARAHEAGIVHRDLKPENVMVTKDGLVKILDFGLAKLTATGSGSDEASHLPTETGTSPGVVLGTVGYMSPEQAAGQPIDYRSDQFSLGSILYEMTTGQRAFQKKTAVDTLSAILNDEPASIASINPQLPAPLRWIVERCLAKEAEARYVSTKDLARELATLRDRLSEASLSGAVPSTESSRRSRRLGLTLLVLTVLGATLFAGALASRPYWKARFSSYPTIRRLTFRRAGIMNARFAPDGQVVYGAFFAQQTRGNFGELLLARPGAFEPRAIGLPPANILSVSSSGELAIIVGGRDTQGTLATVPLGGGAPRELMEDVRWASWAPDGKNLAVIHVVAGKMRLEFPIGKVLYESKGWINRVVFSPSGDLIAISDQGELTVMGLDGKRRGITQALEYGWSPRGDEIWFNEIEAGTTSIHAVTLAGKRRFLAAFPGDFVLHDVSRDGRVLLERASEQFEVVGHVSGEQLERNLSWLDGSVPVDLSADGKTLLFSESRQGGWPNGAVYKRRTDGTPAVRLGDGSAIALSPDGKWALSESRANPSQLILFPTGPGQPRTIQTSGINLLGSQGGFFPDGTRVFFRGAEPGQRARVYVVNLENAQIKPIGPEGIDVQALLFISPDGRQIAVSSGDHCDLIDVEGGSQRVVPGLSAELYAIKWCADGRSLFVRTNGTNPLKVYRLELSSGRLELWREFSVSDIGGGGAVSVIPTPDGRSYVYGYDRYLADLFIAEGLK